MREAFALQKLLTFFNKKYWHIWDINVWNFNFSLTNEVVSFEQPGPWTSDEGKKLQLIMTETLDIILTQNKMGRHQNAKILEVQLGHTKCLC